MELANLTSKYRGKLIIKTFEKFLEIGEKVLDVGCGNGVVSRQLQEHFNLDLTGCDIMDYLKEDIVFVKMESADKLPFPKNSFKTVLFNDVLHHTSYENQERLLSEAFRVGKRVLLFEVEPTTPGKLADFVLNKVHNREMEIPFTFRTSSQWEKLAKKMGVKSKPVKVRKPLIYPFSHVGFVWTKKS